MIGYCIFYSFHLTTMILSRLPFTKLTMPKEVYPLVACVGTAVTGRHRYPSKALHLLTL